MRTPLRLWGPRPLGACRHDTDAGDVVEAVTGSVLQASATVLEGDCARACPNRPSSCPVLRRVLQPHYFAVFPSSLLRPHPGIPSLDEFQGCFHAAQYKASLCAFAANAGFGF